MSIIYVEYELRCDGIPGDPYGCEPAIYAHTAKQARDEARMDGWRFARDGKAYCPRHQGTDGADQ